MGIEQANASQHLAVLRAKNIVVNRKTGNHVLYSVRDPLIIGVLDVMRRYFHAHIRGWTSAPISSQAVGLVALPLAMAFGIASGVPPQTGLYTAIIAGGLISLLGGSRMQIGGPTGAFVVIVAGVVAKFGVGGLAMITVMAGVMLILMGLTGLGSAVKFIPRPVTIGFTHGLALLIASTQIKDFLGLKTGGVPSAFLPRMSLLIERMGTLNWTAVAISAPTLAVVIFLPRVTKRIPIDSRDGGLHCLCRAFQASDRDCWKQVRWDSGRLSSLLHPHI